MQITLNGKNIDITDALRDYVNEKIGKVIKHNGQIINIKVTLSVNKNPKVKKNNVAEASCLLNGSVIRVSEEEETMYAAIDLLSDRFDRQVKDIKEKILKKAKSTTESIRIGEAEEEIPEEEEEEEEETPEEAIKIELE